MLVSLRPLLRENVARTGLRYVKDKNPAIPEVNLCCFGRGFIVDVASGVQHKEWK